MLKRIIPILCASLFVLTSCARGGGTKAQEGGTISVVDQNGMTVTLSKGINRFVATALPLPSVYALTGSPIEYLVGVHPGATSAIKNSVMAAMYPKLAEIPSNFIEGQDINIEALLNLNPQVVMYWADYKNQYEAMNKAGIPVVGVTTQGNGDALVTLESWLEIMGTMFGTTGHTDKVIAYGRTVRQEIADRLKSAPASDAPRVLFLFNHSSDAITTSGNNHYGQVWISSAGGINVAQDLTGTPSINMEQIYQWDPDIIIITTFSNTMPDDLYNNTVKGQNWSQLSAVKNRKVFKEPLGVYRWYPPSGDAPLMLKWMAQTLRPDLFDYDMAAVIKAYYKDFYSYDLSDSQARGILASNPEAAKGASWSQAGQNK